MTEQQVQQQGRVTLDAVYIRWEEDPVQPGEGVVAYAQVSYVCSPSGDRRLETLCSGGLWGIEDASPEYRREVEREELADLKQHLERFGVEVSGFDGLAGAIG